MEHFAIYGCGGNGREILSIVREMTIAHGARPTIVFVSDLKHEIGSVPNGIDVISFNALVSSEHADRKVILSPGSSAGRRKLADKCANAGLQFASIAAATHKRFDEVIVGEGAVFSDFTLCTTNARVGRHFHCNMYSYVAHDCVIGDFVTFAPRVNCNGHIEIGDDVEIGSGAVLRNGSSARPLRIGQGAIIGMGAVVTKDVAPFTTVVGNPARPMTARI